TAIPVRPRARQWRSMADSEVSQSGENSVCRCRSNRAVAMIFLVALSYAPASLAVSRSVLAERGASFGDEEAEFGGKDETLHLPFPRPDHRAKARLVVIRHPFAVPAQAARWVGDEDMLGPERPQQYQSRRFVPLIQERQELQYQRDVRGLDR